VTNSQTIHVVGLLPLADVKFRKKLDESPAERQEDLRQVQGDSPARSRNGDLRKSAAQAAARLGRDNSKANQAASADIAREASKNSEKCDRKSGTKSRIHPRSEAEAPVIKSLHLIKRQLGTHHARHLRDVMRPELERKPQRPASTRRKVLT
jgi:hypothetical protein